MDFAVIIVSVVEALPNSKAGNPIANSWIRSGTSPAPNDGEAQSAYDRGTVLLSRYPLILRRRGTRYLAGNPRSEIIKFKIRNQTLSRTKSDYLSEK